MTTHRLLSLALSLLALGCGSMLPMPRPRSQLPTAVEVPNLRVGIDEVDITPPIGLGMSGHGPESRVASGTQLRLRCQAFVFEGLAPDRKTADRVALVPCELPLPSLLLQREVAKRVRAEKVPLGAERILIMATHTHTSPGHYFGVRNYGGPLSSRLPGFDPRLFDFLADAIAGSIKRAYDDLGRAKIRWSQVAIPPGVARNRSLAAFQRNDELALPKALQRRVRCHRSQPADYAVDPRLSVLRIDRVAENGSEAPYGVLAIFGVHSTALPNTTPWYSGDLFGYATRAVAEELPPREGKKLVVGIANGIEGDVMAARAANGRREAHRLGGLLASHIVKQWRELAGKDQEQSLRVAYRELVLPDALVSTPSGEEARLCERPQLGTSSGGGAPDHPTLFRFFPKANAGARLLESYGCHGTKIPIQMLDGDTEPGVHFPGVAPIALVQLGEMAIVTLPAEVTTQVGERIRDAVASTLPSSEPPSTATTAATTPAGEPSPQPAPAGADAKPADEPSTEPAPGVEAKPAAAAEAKAADECAEAPEERLVAVVGLTNEYLQYVASEAEYPLQGYEGASTLYGPHSAQFLVDQTRCLAAFMHTARLDHICSHQPPVDAVTAVDYPEPDEVDLYDASSDPPSGIEEPSGPAACLTTDGLVAYEVRFRGPEPERVRKRTDLEVEVCECTCVPDAKNPGVCADAKFDHCHPDPTLDPEATLDPNACHPSSTGVNERIVDDDRGTSVSTRFDWDSREWTVSWAPGLAPGAVDYEFRAGRFALIVRSNGGSLLKPFAIHHPGARPPAERVCP